MLAEAGELDAEFTDIVQSGRSAGEITGNECMECCRQYNEHEEQGNVYMTVVRPALVYRQGN